MTEFGESQSIDKRQALNVKHSYDGIIIKAMAACRAAPPPRYHSPSLASVNGRRMALTVTLNLTLTLTLALKLHFSSLFTE